jgi:hypothetical protein
MFALNVDLSLSEPYHGEHGPEVPLTLRVHRFAAGAAKTGLSFDGV